jgi:dipeptidyl aminopeptidase/acylaminoacyl peptidase
MNTPILIIHGEDDKRVPTTQSIGLMRGLLREGGPQAKPQLVTYPREGHVFEERAHVEDVLNRVLEHINMHLK